MKGVITSFFSNKIGKVFLNLNEQIINIATILYERLMLSIPLRKVHPIDEDGHYTCNADILRYLENETLEDTDEEDSDDESVNPIWKELQKLKKQ